MKTKLKTKIVMLFKEVLLCAVMSECISMFGAIWLHQLLVLILVITFCGAKCHFIKWPSLPECHHHGLISESLQAEKGRLKLLSLYFMQK